MTTIKKKLSKDKTPWGCIILFVFPFVFIGLFSFSYAAYNSYKALLSKKWNTTNAFLEKIDIESHKSSGRSGISHQVLLEYKYTIDNIQYIGNKIAFGYGFNNTEAHHKLYEHLKNATEIVIYSNPKNRSESVIAPGINNSIIGVFIFSIVWNATLIFFYLKIRKKLHTNQLFFLLIFIWIVGIALIVGDFIHIPLENKIEILNRNSE